MGFGKDDHEIILLILTASGITKKITKIKMVVSVG